MEIKSKEMTKNRSFYQKKTERRYTTKLTEETNEKKDIKNASIKFPLMSMEHYYVKSTLYNL